MEHRNECPQQSTISDLERKLIALIAATAVEQVIAEKNTLYQSRRTNTPSKNDSIGGFYNLTHRRNYPFAISHEAFGGSLSTTPGAVQQVFLSAPSDLWRVANISNILPLFFLYTTLRYSVCRQLKNG